ncbi:MAG: M56 family metallopeptidase [Planctomycetota bacterium]
MSEVWNAAADLWWQWLAATALPGAVMAVGVRSLELGLGARLGARLATLLWGAVLVRLLVPFAGPWSLDAAPLAGGWSAASVPGATPAAAAWLGLAFGCWLVGAACGLLALAAGAARARSSWLIDAARPPAGVREAAGHAAQRLGLRRPVRVRVVHGAAGPAVVGLLRPVVVLPARLLGVAGGEGRARLEHVLLHELAHVRRRDPLAAALCIAVRAPLWLHPAAWLAVRRLAAQREIGCDAAVVRALGSSHAYRRTLLELAALRHLRPIGLTVPFGGGRQLLVRLRRLERGRSSRRARRVAALAGAVAAALTLSLFAGAPTLAPRRPTAPADAVAALSLEPSFGAAAGCLRRRFVVLAALAARGDLPAPAPSPSPPER